MKGFNLNEAISNVVNGITSVVNNMVDTIGMVWAIILGVIIVVLVLLYTSHFVKFINK